MNKLDHVNILQGTASTYEFSNGNALPLTAAPFGMNHWSPQTEVNADRRFFSPHSHVFRGLRLTHQPSPWIGDYATLLILPQTGPKLVEENSRYSAINPDDMVLRPDYFELELLRYQTRMRMAPGCRSAIITCDFPQAVEKRIIMDLFSGRNHIELSQDRHSVSGWTSYNSGGVPDNFKMYFKLELSSPVSEMSEAPGGCCLELPVHTDTVAIRMATSFISISQACVNLKREVTGKELEEVQAVTAGMWNKLLRKIVVDGSEEQMKTFYSCLYRTFLFPRVFHEYEDSGSMLHYSPYDGGVHPGPMYADNGFWDTHRTVYPLFSLILPDIYAEMLQGWTNAALEGGWFPRWSSPGYRSCMIGTHADVVVADAVAKGITGFDVETAYRFMLKNAFELGCHDGLFGRKGIVEYGEYGYVPDDRYEHAASRTMDYAYNDFAIAQVAKCLGDNDNYEKLIRRSQNYRNTFNPSNGWMQGRNADGSWKAPFSEFEWGGSYIEGAAWQCGWAVPHDIDGLIVLHGGKENFTAKLDKMLSIQPVFEVGSYNQEIHEMTEMAVAGFGQYAHSNQPVHHLLWLYAHSGKPEKTRYWVKRVAEEMYYFDMDGFPGDEDNGEMAAWYIFACLGLYPVCPGKAEYTLAEPLFDRIELTTGSGIVQIQKHGKGRFNMVCRDNQRIDSPSISHGDFINSDKLSFSYS